MTRTRFAPSPTGYLHIGGARTALYCWLYARKHRGQFVLRIEDTDPERSTPESIQAILDAMDWLGLDYDEGPIYQSRRFERYREVAQQLLDAGMAYRCYCTREELDALRAEQEANKQKPRYDGRFRDYDGPPREGVEPVIRFKNPLAGTVEFDDLIRGPIGVDNAELDDLVILRADGSPTYNFSVVVDDHDMRITQVIRGDDHINNTPRQINIFHALGVEPPQFAHVPMILGPDGARLSKRHGAAGVMEYRDDGILPQALLNYLVRLGWSYGDQELFSRDEMIALFSLDAVNRAPSALNPDKLYWINQQYLVAEPDRERLAALLREQLLALDGVDAAALAAGPALGEVVDAYRERGRTLREIARNCRFLFAEFDGYDARSTQALNADAAATLGAVRDALAGLTDWQAGPLHDAVTAVGERLGVKFGRIGAPLRAALTGGAPAPGIDVTLALVGRERTLARIDRALAQIAAGG